MGKVIYAKVGDTGPLQTVTLEDRNEAPVDLTGATVVMQVAGQATTVARTLVDAAAGKVRPGRTNLPEPSGTSPLQANVEFEVTYSDTTVQTFPEDGYLILKVWPDLDS